MVKYYKYLLFLLVLIVGILFVPFLGADKSNNDSGKDKDPAPNSNSEKTSEPNTLLMPYTEALEFLDIEVTALVTDVETGISYQVKRIGGVNHADVETLTSEDTEKLKSTYNDEWSWQRRAVIVNIDGIEIAGSMAAMPHSGREDAPFGAIVDNRSGGSGRGINLNSIRDNNMNGVVDIYFYNSLIPGLNRIDERHQYMVLKAAQSKNESAEGKN